MQVPTKCYRNSMEIREGFCIIASTKITHMRKHFQLPKTIPYLSSVTGSRNPYGQSAGQFVVPAVVCVVSGKPFGGRICHLVFAGHAGVGNLSEGKRTG